MNFTHSKWMESAHIAYVSAGSNLGNRKTNLEFGLKSLEKWSAVLNVSSYFETEPVGFADQPWFLNLAIELETRLTPYELLSLCQNTEIACGRIRSFSDAPRTLDLDILLYGSIIMSEEGLVIPHPRLQNRKFVLIPLAQIAPHVMHPVLKKPIRSLLEVCPDSSEVRISAF
jgi:2-amino-4-hydroxy-6-hydroxymethyldihydropteridine diphosphokinase